MILKHARRFRVEIKVTGYFLRNERINPRLCSHGPCLLACSALEHLTLNCTFRTSHRHGYLLLSPQAPIGLPSIGSENSIHATGDKGRARGIRPLLSPPAPHCVRPTAHSWFYVSSPSWRNSYFCVLCVVFWRHVCMCMVCRTDTWAA